MEPVFEIDSDDLRAAIDACSKATANPKDRPELSEVWAERIGDGKVRFVGTDGKLMHIVTVTAKCNPGAVRFPADACKLLPGVLRRSIASLDEAHPHGDEERVARVSRGGVDLGRKLGLAFHQSAFETQPDIEKILVLVPDDAGACSPGLNFRYVASAGAAAKSVSEGRWDALRMKAGANTSSPVSFEMATAHRQFTAIIMPVRLDEVAA